MAGNGSQSSPYEFIPPRYEPGQITVSVFQGGSESFSPVNHPPEIPGGDIYPDNGDSITAEYLVLRWNGSDPDPSDSVTYDIYLDTSF